MATAYMPTAADRQMQIDTARQQQIAQANALRMALRRRVQQDVQAESLTPEGVSAYAALHLTTDSGLPVLPAPHHRVWLHFLCNAQITKLLIIAPPESAKTTWVLSAFTGAYIGAYPERSVIIASSTGPIAEKRSLSLRNAVYSQAWRATYPNLAPAVGLPWKAMQWSLAPGGIPHPGRLHPTISSYGTGGSVVGSRADLIVADDILDDKNTATGYQREFISHWFHTTLYSRLKSQTGRIVVIGTAWHSDDLYARLRRDGHWTIVHVRLLADEHESQQAYIQYPDSYTGPRLGTPLSTPPPFIPGAADSTLATDIPL